MASKKTSMCGLASGLAFYCMRNLHTNMHAGRRETCWATWPSLRARLFRQANTSFGLTTSFGNSTTRVVVLLPSRRVTSRLLTYLSHS